MCDVRFKRGYKEVRAALKEKKEVDEEWCRRRLREREREEIERDAASRYQPGIRPTHTIRVSASALFAPGSSLNV